ncbi:FAD-dependent monooxygenase [Pseudomonas lini]
MNTLSTLAPKHFRQPGNTPTVMIVGAGPIGLSLAIMLKKWGVSFRIIEKNAGPSTATKAMAIHSRTLEISRSGRCRSGHQRRVHYQPVFGAVERQTGTELQLLQPGCYLSPTPQPATTADREDSARATEYVGSRC